MKKQFSFKTAREANAEIERLEKELGVPRSAFHASMRQAEDRVALLKHFEGELRDLTNALEQQPATLKAKGTVGSGGLKFGGARCQGEAEVIPPKPMPQASLTRAQCENAMIEHFKESKTKVRELSDAKLLADVTARIIADGLSCPGISGSQEFFGLRPGLSKAVRAIRQESLNRALGINPNQK